MFNDEFSIIGNHFSNIGPARETTRLGVGDDAAVVEIPGSSQLVVCMDSLISGVHFSEDTPAADIAYKALAVNLSDLAAMAAEPDWFQMSLTLPHSDPEWLSQFASGLRQTAENFNLQLIGGDTCRGPLSITIQIAGLVESDCYVTRSGARPGDLIVVSGELGNAALGLAHRQDSVELPPGLKSKCLLALDRPRPRLEMASFLQDYASAAIDLSDGLLGDLGHILEASGCGAWIEEEALPVNDWIEQEQAYRYALSGGDDYEICCCVPAKFRSDIDAWNPGHPACQLSIIGEITDAGFFLRQRENRIDLGNARGYQHFS